MSPSDTGAMGASDAMTFTGGSMSSMTSVDKKLRSTVDPIVASTCHGYIPPWADTKGGLVCNDGHGLGVKVIYIQFPKDSVMMAHFNVFQNVDAKSPEAGDCLASPYENFSQSVPQRPLSSTNHLPAPPAQLVCVPSDGNDEFVWTNVGASVIGEAESNGPSDEAKVDLVKSFYLFFGPYARG
jgi:hypothetical protein